MAVKNGTVNPDNLLGTAGKDTLNGKAGADTMTGLAGSDTYYVDNIGDVVIEAANQGNDTIITNLATFSLASLAEIENLKYNGTLSFYGEGNSSANLISGSKGNDTLIGGGGHDTLTGDAGNDTYVVDNVGVKISDTTGIDTFSTSSLTNIDLNSYAKIENLSYTGSAAFTGIGNKLNNEMIGGTAADVLSGGAGNDTLNGNGGNDTLSGGTGDDIFVYDNIGVTLHEGANQGNDTILTSLSNVSLTSFSNIENLIYHGLTAFTGTGDTFNNSITGDAGNDTLNGGAGNDTLIGGAGNDSLLGGDGNDLLQAGIGVDTLTGGAGKDIFDFNTISVSNIPNGTDYITDFSAGDKIDLTTQQLTAIKSQGSYTTVSTIGGASGGGTTVTTTHHYNTGYIEIYVDGSSVSSVSQLYQAIDAAQTYSKYNPQDPIANGAALIDVSGGSYNGTYLFLNDNNAAVTSSDALIHLNGLDIYNDTHTNSGALDFNIFM